MNLAQRVAAEFKSNRSENIILSGVASAEENTNVVITIDNYDVDSNYTISVTGGSYVDNEDGTITWTLPDITDLNDHEHTIGVFSTKLGELKSFIGEHVVTVVYVPVPTPIFSGVTSAEENTDVLITIDNYDANGTYDLSVDGGSFVDNGNGTITWTLPGVDTDTDYKLTGTFTNVDGTSLPSTHTVTALFVAVATPVLTGVSSANELSDAVITITNYDVGNTYDITVSAGTFVNNGNGTITWTLPEVATDTAHYMDVFATNVNGTSNTARHNLTVIDIPVTTPLLSGPTSGTENTDIAIVIDNYDPTAIYNINIEAGAYVRNAGSITWTLPEVSANTDYDIQVSATVNAVTSSIATKTVTVVDVPVTGDDNVVVSDYQTIVGTNDGFDYV